MGDKSGPCIKYIDNNGCLAVNVNKMNRAQLEEFANTRGIFTKPKKATVKELKSLISQWVDDYGPNEKLQTLEVDISFKAPTAICVHGNILFVADAGIGKVLQLLVEESNLKLKAKASSLFTYIMQISCGYQIFQIMVAYTLSNSVKACYNRK